MPSSGSRDGSVRSKRRSIFALSSLTHIHAPASAGQPGTDDANQKLRKKRTPSVTTDLPPLNTQLVTEPDDTLHSAESTPRKEQRPSTASRPGLGRPSSVFGSLKSMRSHGDDEYRLQHHPSEQDWSNALAKNVIYHGEVQTSSSVFRRKKEYLVLTETHIVRCKSLSKAAETFQSIQPNNARSPTIRHGSSHSVSSTHDAVSFGSDSSGDKDGRTSLRHIVSVHAHDDSKPYSAIEVCALDEDNNQASAMTLQFGQPEERDTWLAQIRAAAVRLRTQGHINATPFNANYAARTVEREGDYDPDHFQLYKVVQRHSPKIGGRASTDDMSKLASVVCFLAIGIHKVHLIPLPKTATRTSSTTLNQTSHGSYGILTLNAIKLNSRDDSFELTFRQPIKRPITLHLASAAAPAIALRLHYVEHYLRPECAHWLYKFEVPPELEASADVAIDSNAEEHSCLDRTLTAYCIAYDINPSRIRYTINYDCEDAPRFELLQPSDARRQNYSSIELLAIFRALRYNESFASMSFQDICLDSLHNLSDLYGVEYVCIRTKRGTPLKFQPNELSKASLLIQEIRAIASTTKKLRRLNFSRCITIQPPEASDDNYRAKDAGCGIVEALLPLCRHQTTNVDWINLSGITLSDTDLDYLVAAACDRNCHFRALELGKCGLGDRTLSMLLDALRAHDNTLEALDMSDNFARVSPNVFDAQIGVFGFIRYLDISRLPRTSGPEPLISADTLLTWRLETLKLSGINMNERSVEDLAIYLKHQQSFPLKELVLDNTLLTGKDIATIMEALPVKSGQGRDLHLDISHNRIFRHHDALCHAFEAGHAPTHVTLRAMEYRDETVLRSLLNALRKNHTTKYLDISRASLPGDASEETSNALRRLFSENDTLEEIDISGEDSRLETSKFGVGLNRALEGLRHNRTLRILRIQYQKLGVMGAGILADVLKDNDALREMHCDHNEIPLSAFTDLVNALHKNTTLVYLPQMDECRNLALKQTEKQVKLIRDEASLQNPPPTPPKASALGMRKGLATVKRHTARASSASNPSFPLLATSRDRSVSSPHLPASGKRAPSTIAPLPQLSEQDILAALRLVAESWDRQQYRLQQYLQRNWHIMHGIDVPMDIEEEEFERPSSMASLSKVLEKVKMDATPRAERDEPDLYAASMETSSDDSHPSTSIDTSDRGGDSTGTTHSRAHNHNSMDGLIARAAELMPDSSPTTIRVAALSAAMANSAATSSRRDESPRLHIDGNVIDGRGTLGRSGPFGSAPTLTGLLSSEPVSPVSEIGSPLSRWGSDSIAEEDETAGGDVSPIAADEERLEIHGLGIRG